MIAAMRRGLSSYSTTEMLAVNVPELNRQRVLRCFLLLFFQCSIPKGNPTVDNMFYK